MMIYMKILLKEKKKEEGNLSKEEKDKRKWQMKLKSELNMGIKLSPEDKKVTEVSFNKKQKNEQKEKEEQKKEESPKNKPKSKIDMLLNNELDENKESNNKKKGKKKKGKYVDFNIKDFDFDKDFPKLK